jgi:hypothetical protein
VTLLFDHHVAQDEVARVLSGKLGRQSFVSSIDISNSIRQDTGKVVPYIILIRVLATMQDNHIIHLTGDGWRLVVKRSRLYVTSGR